jgi:hypothetical protein
LGGGGWFAAGCCHPGAEDWSAGAAGCWATSGVPQVAQNAAFGAFVPPQRGHLTSFIASHLEYCVKNSDHQQPARGTLARLKGRGQRAGCAVYGLRYPGSCSTGEENLRNYSGPANLKQSLRILRWAGLPAALVDNCHNGAERCTIPDASQSRRYLRRLRRTQF